MWAMLNLFGASSGFDHQPEWGRRAALGFPTLRDDVDRFLA